MQEKAEKMQQEANKLKDKLLKKDEKPKVVVELPKDPDHEPSVEDLAA